MSRGRESRLGISKACGRFAAIRRSLGASLIVGLALALSLATGPVMAQQPLTLQGEGTRHTLSVEVARTPQERSRGLMERDSLAADAGMLFLYASQQPGSSAYWMYRTRIPLDIAFLDAGGVIRSLQTMAPCRAEAARTCPTYPAGVPFRAALETNAGYFDAKGLGVGDRVDLSPWIPSP